MKSQKVMFFTFKNFLIDLFLIEMSHFYTILEISIISIFCPNEKFSLSQKNEFPFKRVILLKID